MHQSKTLDDEVEDSSLLSVEGQDLPAWLQTVNIDLEELKRELDCQLYVIEIDKHQRFIDSFVKKNDMK